MFRQLDLVDLPNGPSTPFVCIASLLLFVQSVFCCLFLVSRRIFALYLVCLPSLSCNCECRAPLLSAHRQPSGRDELLSPRAKHNTHTPIELVSTISLITPPCPTITTAPSPPSALHYVGRDGDHTTQALSKPCRSPRSNGRAHSSWLSEQKDPQTESESCFLVDKADRKHHQK